MQFEFQIRMQQYVQTNKKLLNSLITPVLSTKVMYELSKTSMNLSTSTQSSMPSMIISRALSSSLIDSSSVEERKCIFIQDEDEEDDLVVEKENTNHIDDEVDEYMCENSTLSVSNDFYDDDDVDQLGDESANLSLIETLSNGSSGYSTPQHEINTHKLPSPSICTTQNDFNSDLMKNSLKSTIRATSAAFADFLTGAKTKRRALDFSNFDLDEKRAFHILSERRRRYDLKNLFEDLRLSLPSLINKQKASKVTILKTAVDHLCEIKTNNEKLKLIFQRESIKQKNLIERLKNLEETNVNLS